MIPYSSFIVSHLIAGYINIISLLIFIAFNSKGVKNAIFSAREEVGQYNQKKKKGRQTKDNFLSLKASS